MSHTSPHAIPFTKDDFEGSVPERFARVAAAWPSAVAVACGHERVTYEALDRRSNRLAAAIVRAAPDRAAPVAVVLNNPVSMVVAILATWKAGKISVAVEPSYPPARISAILEDSAADLVVTDAEAQRVIDELRGVGALSLRMDELDLPEEATPPRLTASPDSPLYLVYTSGSTGAPKGVVLTHRNRFHRIGSVVGSLGVKPGDRVSALHSPSFGAGMRDVLTALLTGAMLLPFDVRQAGLGALADWIDREEVSVLFAVVSTFRHLLARLDPARRFRSVRVVRLGSEALYREDIVAFRRHFPDDGVLVAGYGASEGNGFSEYRIGPNMPLPVGRVPAGYPLEGVQFLIVDDDMQPVEPGQVGEVVVRSANMSPGYWRRSDLTRAAFLADPDRGPVRLYRTGDVGRLAPDGCLELVGRKDHQVKVRGYRVHPGEIETALALHPALREAVVIGRPDVNGELRLVAYVVSDTSPAPAAAALRQFLHARLPAYMIPGAFVELDVLPSLPNGKVDRAALPPPPASTNGREAEFIAPASPLEHQIAEIWEELLGVRPVGATDDFFDLGGNSLLAAAFVTALEPACGHAVPPAVLFEASTVADLAALLVHEEAQRGRRVIPLRATGALPPLFFLHGDYNGGGFYCHALARSLEPDRPFYAVHPHGLGDGSVPETIEAMAADLVEALRAVRPHGPYALGGHCNGGFVALEMAHQLRAAGERVDALVLVEACAPGPGLRTLHRVSAALGRLCRLTAARRAALLARIERGSEDYAARARYYEARLAALARGGLHAQAEAVGRAVGRGRRRLADILEHGRQAAPTLQEAERPRLPGQRTGPREVYHRALRRYLPPAYSGRVAVIQAAEEPTRPTALGWRAFLPHVRVAVVPGDHLTCVTRHVASFGPELERALHGR